MILDIHSGARLARAAATILIAATLHAAPSAAASIKKADWVADYTAIAMGTGHVGAAAGRASRFEIEIYRWTTPEERQTILKLIQTGDAKAIRKGLDDLEEVGRIRMPGQAGYELVYAFEFDEGGKKRVVAATNRPFLSMPGATSGNSVDFLVGVAMLELEASGDGTGVVAPAIELAIDASGKMDITESAADPVQLTSVTSNKK
jgi:hypothetical protein